MYDNLYSPSLQHDFETFVNTFRPNLAQIVDWLKDHVDPECVYNRYEIKEDFAPEDLYDLESLAEVVGKKCDPQYVFNEKKLDKWAKENGYYGNE